MGRKKINIEKIQDDRYRGITFSKRWRGLTKKAAELAILCDCRIGLIALVKDERSSEGKVFKHSTVDMEEIILEYLNHDGEVMEEIFSQIDMDGLSASQLETISNEAASED